MPMHRALPRLLPFWLLLALTVPAPAQTISQGQVKPNTNGVPAAEKSPPRTLSDNIDNLRFWLMSPDVSDPGHIHDGRYYGKTAMDALLALKYDQSGGALGGSAWPGLDLLYDLGTPTLRWRNLYVDEIHAGKVFGDGSGLTGVEGGGGTFEPPANMVTTDTEQTITAPKTLAAGLKVKGALQMGEGGGDDPHLFIFGAGDQYQISAPIHVRMGASDIFTVDREGNVAASGTLEAVGLKVLAGAGEGKVLTSDAFGTAIWQDPSGGVGGTPSNMMTLDTVQTATAGKTIHVADAAQVPLTLRTPAGSTADVFRAYAGGEAQPVFKVGAGGVTARGLEVVDFSATGLTSLKDTIVRNGRFQVEGAAPAIDMWRTGDDTVAGLELGSLAYNGTVDSVVAVPGAFIAAVSTEDWTLTGGRGARLELRTTANGLQTPATRLTLNEQGAKVAGVVDASGGYLVNGSGGTTGQVLVSDGTSFKPGTVAGGGTGGTEEGGADLAANNLWTGYNEFSNGLKVSSVNLTLDGARITTSGTQDLYLQPGGRTLVYAGATAPSIIEFISPSTGVAVGSVSPAGQGLFQTVDAKGGYLVNGSGGTAGQGLVSDGTSFKPATLHAEPPANMATLDTEQEFTAKKFFAQGLQTTAAGSFVDARGGFKVNASGGTSGQVLVSDGTSFKPGSAPASPPSGTAGGDLSGAYPSPTVDGLQGRAVASTAPTDGQALVFSGANNRWEPGALMADLPTNAVTTDTVQSITGAKTFSYLKALALQIQNGSGVRLGGWGADGILDAKGIKVDGSGGTAGQVLVSDGTSFKPGTVEGTGGGSAPANMVTTDTAQTITGTKTFSTILASTIGKSDGSGSTDLYGTIYNRNRLQLYGWNSSLYAGHPNNSSVETLNVTPDGNISVYNQIGIKRSGAWQAFLDKDGVLDAKGIKISGSGGSIGQALISDGTTFKPGTLAATLPDLTPTPAGTYNNASITVDAQGRVTAAASGTTSGIDLAADYVWTGQHTFRNKPLKVENNLQSNFSTGLSVYKRGNTSDASGAVASDAELGYHSFYGWNGSDYVRGAYALARANQAWSTSQRGTSYQIWTATPGTNTEAQRVVIDSAGLKIATGGLTFPDGTSMTTAATGTGGTGGASTSVANTWTAQQSFKADANGSAPIRVLNNAGTVVGQWKADGGIEANATVRAPSFTTGNGGKYTSISALVLQAGGTNANIVRQPGDANSQNAYILVGQSYNGSADTFRFLANGNLWTSGDVAPDGDFLLGNGRRFTSNYSVLIQPKSTSYTTVIRQPGDANAQGSIIAQLQDWQGNGKFTFYPSGNFKATGDLVPDGDFVLDNGKRLTSNYGVLIQPKSSSYTTTVRSGGNSQILDLQDNAGNSKAAFTTTGARIEGDLTLNNGDLKLNGGSIKPSSGALTLSGYGTNPVILKSGTTTSGNYIADFQKNDGTSVFAVSNNGSIYVQNGSTLDLSATSKDLKMGSGKIVSSTGSLILQGYSTGPVVARSGYPSAGYDAFQVQKSDGTSVFAVSNNGSVYLPAGSTLDLSAANDLKLGSNKIVSNSGSLVLQGYSTNPVVARSGYQSSGYDAFQVQKSDGASVFSVGNNGSVNATGPVTLASGSSLDMSAAGDLKMGSNKIYSASSNLLLQPYNTNAVIVRSGTTSTSYDAFQIQKNNGTAVFSVDNTGNAKLDAGGGNLIVQSASTKITSSGATIPVVIQPYSGADTILKAGTTTGSIARFQKSDGTTAASLDAAAGILDVLGGYKVNGSGGTSGQVLMSDGTSFKPGTLPTLPANLVTTDTAQTISGAKTFSAAATFSGGLSATTLTATADASFVNLAASGMIDAAGGFKVNGSGGAPGQVLVSDGVSFRPGTVSGGGTGGGDTSSTGDNTYYGRNTFRAQTVMQPNNATISDTLSYTANSYAITNGYRHYWIKFNSGAYTNIPCASLRVMKTGDSYGYAGLTNYLQAFVYTINASGNPSTQVAASNVVEWKDLTGFGWNTVTFTLNAPVSVSTDYILVYRIYAPYSIAGFTVAGGPSPAGEGNWRHNTTSTLTSTSGLTANANLHLAQAIYGGTVMIGEGPLLSVQNPFTETMPATASLFSVTNGAGSILDARNDGTVSVRTLSTESLLSHGTVNAREGFLVNGSGGTAGQILVSDGASFKPGPPMGASTATDNVFHGSQDVIGKASVSTGNTALYDNLSRSDSSWGILTGHYLWFKVNSGSASTFARSVWRVKRRAAPLPGQTVPTNYLQALVSSDNAGKPGNVLYTSAQQSYNQVTMPADWFLAEIPMSFAPQPNTDYWIGLSCSTSNGTYGGWYASRGTVAAGQGNYVTSTGKSWADTYTPSETLVVTAALYSAVGSFGSTPLLSVRNPVNASLDPDTALFEVLAGGNTALAAMNDGTVSTGPLTVVGDARVNGALDARDGLKVDGFGGTAGQVLVSDGASFKPGNPNGATTTADNVLSGRNTFTNSVLFEPAADVITDRLALADSPIIPNSGASFWLKFNSGSATNIHSAVLRMMRFGYHATGYAYARLYPKDANFDMPAGSPLKDGAYVYHRNVASKDWGLQRFLLNATVTPNTDYYLAFYFSGVDATNGWQVSRGTVSDGTGDYATTSPGNPQNTDVTKKLTAAVYATVGPVTSGPLFAVRAPLPEMMNAGGVLAEITSGEDTILRATGAGLTTGPLSSTAAIDAAAGYTVAGSGGEAGQVLLSDGTAFKPGALPANHARVDASNTFVGDQTVQGDVTANRIIADGSLLTNLPNGALSDLDPSPAGTYTNPTITVDAKGRVTAAAEGPAGNTSAAMQWIRHGTGSNLQMGNRTIEEGFERTPYGFTFVGSWAATFSTSDFIKTGLASLKSPATANSGTQETYFDIAVPSYAVNPTLTFWHNVESENNYDWFRVLVDGVEKLKRSGPAGWQQFTYAFQPGATYRVTFRYSKDGGGATGRDAVYIDDLVFSYTGDPGTLSRGFVLEPQEHITVRGASMATDMPADKALKLRVYHLNGTAQLGAALAETSAIPGPGEMAWVSAKFASAVQLLAGERYVVALCNATPGDQTLRTVVYPVPSDPVNGLKQKLAAFEGADPGDGAAWTITNEDPPVGGVLMDIQ